MKRILLTTTAVVAMLGAPALADTARSSATEPMVTGAELSMNDFIGETVWVSADDGTGEAEAIGEIADALFAEDGQVEAVLVDIGGFLGVGERRVALDMDAVVIAHDTDGALIVTTALSRAQLEAAPMWDAAAAARKSVDARSDAEPEIVKSEMEDATGTDAEIAADGAMTTGAAADAETWAAVPTTATEEGADDLAAAEGAVEAATGDPAPTDEGLAAPAADDDRVVWREVDPASVPAEMLEGVTVYGPDEDAVGEIGGFVGLDGQTQAIVETGGFLGIGEKPILVPLADLRVMSQPETGEVKVHTAMTARAIEAAPAFKG